MSSTDNQDSKPKVEEKESPTTEQQKPAAVKPETDEPSAPDSMNVKVPPELAGDPTNISVPSTIYVIE